MIRRWVALLAVLSLGACGVGAGGGDSTGSGGPAFLRMFGGQSESPAPSEADAGRLLSQATFGATDASIDAVRAGTIPDWIQGQIALPPPTQTHLAHVEARLAQLIAANPTAMLGAEHFYETWWRTSVTSPDQLRQRVAFAYSQIFVISLNTDVVDIRGAASY
jgi:uncharacterized protein (DUF1800 family)